jgi:hypothetical protein
VTEDVSRLLAEPFFSTEGAIWKDCLKRFEVSKSTRT